MEQLYKEIVNFQRKCNDYIDVPSHQIAQSLRQEVQRLEDDAQVRKNPESIEQRLKQVIRLLEEAGKHQVMSTHHADEMVDIGEDLRRELQKLK